MNDDNVHTTDVLVIGAGLAGMQVALHVDGHRVTLVDAGLPGESGASPLARGGIAVPVGGDDRPRFHAEDTLESGAGLCHHGAVQLATEQGAARLRELLEMGVRFDRTTTEELALGREAAHSKARIVHARGDATGEALCSTLAAHVEQRDEITVRSQCRAVELITQPGGVTGAWLEQADGHLQAVLARCTVVAAGGIGQLFAHTSNPLGALGSGHMLAYRAGASLVDLEFVQFHPTALAVDDNPLPLLTEAIRGEGAVLVDGGGRRFMDEIHPDAELAPRDVVARAVWRRRNDGDEVFLDATAIGDAFAERFPSAYRDCRRAGLDPARDPLPVRPAAHYHMGGISVDLDGRTRVDGLWACGEVASTGLHGANRLASNSLLEAIVFGARVGRSISHHLQTGSHLNRTDLDLAEPKPPNARLELDSPAREGGIARLREIMWRDVGVMRSHQGLWRALAELDELAASFRGSPLLGEAVALASLICIAAFHRRESRGAHCRTDYPRASSKWRNRQVFEASSVRTEPQNARRYVQWERVGALTRPRRL